MSEMRRDAVPLAVKEIAERLAAQHGGDFIQPVTPRWLGGQLRNRLSLVPVKSHGTFVVPPTEAPRLEALFKRYGVTDRVDVGTSETSEGGAGGSEEAMHGSN